MITNRDIAAVLRDVVAKKRGELRAMTDSTPEARQKLRWGIRSIDYAADQIDALQWPIKEPAQALSIPGVGAKIAARIAEFLQTGRLRELEGWTRDRESTRVPELMTVYGIGPERAQALAQEGVVTVDLLRQAVRLGLVAVPRSTERALQYHDELQKKISRTEMMAFEALLQGIIRQVAPGATAMVLGSYRRGAKQSRDIDLLITRPDDVQGLLRDTVNAFAEQGIVRACLSSGDTKYHGIVALSRHHLARRIDIRAVERDSMGPAQMYFTGSKRWNIRLRARALRHGYTLNEYRLVRKRDGRRIPCPDEASIFTALGMSAVPPGDRI